MAQANNLIQIKRTSISGRAANTTTLPNPGELALNMTDGILYSGNGSVVFEIGANNTNVNVSGNLAVKAIIANNSIGAYGQVLYSSGSDVYWGPGAAGFTGSRGDLGYTGSFGTTGFTGSVGYVGSKGDVGFVGSRGDLGYTGSSGYFGSTGFTGSAATSSFTNGQSISVNNLISTGQIYVGNGIVNTVITDTSITTPLLNITSNTGISTFSTELDATTPKTVSFGAVPLNSATANGYTVEFFVKFRTLPSTGTSDFAGTTSNQLGLQANTSTIQIVNKGYSTAGDLVYKTFQNNVWYHFAYIGQSNNTYIAIDGQVTNLNNIGGYSGYTPTGTWAGGWPKLSGNAVFSNFRVVTNQGGNVYDINGFTPPNSPLTAIANTKILTLIGNTFVDASGTNTTITTAGSPTLINDRVVTINQAITTTIDGTTLSVSNIYTNFLYANNAAGNTGQLLAANSTGGIFWTSVVGYTGSTGFTGSVGFVGSKGDLGYTGSRGTDGVIGYNGSLGYTGSRGDLGYTGSQGVGFAGSVGYAGSQGVGFTGSVGYVGSKGDLGYVGSQGPQGSFGGAAFDYTFNANTNNSDPTNGNLKLSNTDLTLANTLYISENADNFQSIYTFLQTIDDSTSAIKGHFTVTEKANTANFVLYAITGSHAHYTNYFAVPSSYLNGSANNFTNNLDIIITFARTGDIGDTGSVGFTGSVGGTGYTGSFGNTGFTGSVGYAGSKGDTGYTGSLGYTGSQGDLGYTGSRGTDGVIGYNGSVGFVGSKGDLGYTGSVGYTGSFGATGFTGSVGYTGSFGDIGFTGSAGYTGSKGDLGYTGSQGAGFTGSVGYVGSQGDIGYVGSRGIDGVIGYNGSLGYTGSQGSGYTGSAGPQGVSVYVSATAPVAPANGDVWWNTNLGSLFIYYDDGDTSQWVSAAPSAGVITPTADPFNQFLLAGM